MPIKAHISPKKLSYTSLTGVVIQVYNHFATKHGYISNGYPNNILGFKNPKTLSQNWNGRDKTPFPSIILVTPQSVLHGVAFNWQKVFLGIATVGTLFCRDIKHKGCLMGS